MEGAPNQYGPTGGLSSIQKTELKMNKLTCPGLIIVLYLYLQACNTSKLNVDFSKQNEPTKRAWPIPGLLLL